MIKSVQCRNGHEVSRVVVIEEADGTKRVGLQKGQPEPEQKRGVFVWTCSECGDEVTKYPSKP